MSAEVSPEGVFVFVWVWCVVFNAVVTFVFMGSPVLPCVCPPESMVFGADVCPLHRQSPVGLEVIFNAKRFTSKILFFF